MGKKTKTKLKPGETLCPKCKGTGKGKSWEAGGYEISPECPKCQGDGKFDWIDRVMGKPRRLFGQLEAELIDKMSKELAKEIDKEIIEQLIDTCNKEKEHNKKEDKHDNRVISKLLFHPIIKQNIKGKKD